MVLPLFVTLVLGAEPKAIQLAAPGLTGVNLPADVAAFFNEHLATELNRAQLRVVTPREIGTLLGIERQRQLVGCGESSSSCLAELGGALGVDGVVVGDIANLAGRYQINLKIIASTNARHLTSFTARAADPGEVVELLTEAAAKMGVEVRQALTPASVAAAGEARSSPWLRAPVVASGAVAIAAGVAAAILLAHAQSAHVRLTSGPPLMLDEGLKVRNDGQLTHALGLASVGVGCLALAGAVAFGLWGPSGTKVTVLPTGLGLAIGGTFR